MCIEIYSELSQVAFYKKCLRKKYPCIRKIKHRKEGETEKSESIKRLIGYLVERGVINRPVPKAINNTDLFFSDVFSSLVAVYTRFNYATQKGMFSVMS